MDVDVPPAALPVELSQLKHSMLWKEACCYDVPYMNVTVFSHPMPVDKQGTNVTVYSSLTNSLTNRPLFDGLSPFTNCTVLSVVTVPLFAPGLSVSEIPV